MTIHLHQQESAGNLRDNVAIFISQQGRWDNWTSLHVSKLLYMITWILDKPTVVKFRQKSENELFNTIWKSLSLKGDTHFCCITQRTLLGGQRLWSGFLVFFSVYFWVLVCGNFLFSCQTNYTDNKAIWIFLFLNMRIFYLSTWKSLKLNGIQFIHIGEISFWLSNAEIFW